MEKIIKEIFMEQLKKNPKTKKIIEKKIIETFENIDTKEMSKEITSQILESINSFDYCDCLNEPFDKMLSESLKNLTLSLNAKKHFVKKTTKKVKK